MHNEVSSKTGSRLAELGNLDEQSGGAQAEWRTGGHNCAGEVRQPTRALWLIKLSW